MIGPETGPGQEEEMQTTVLVVALLASGWTPSPEVEIWATALLHGVDPTVALAIHDTESGDVPESGGLREKVVSKGNYGRFQVNCTSWKKKLGLRRCRELLDRHRNIHAGLYVLARFQGKFAHSDGHRCTCRRRVKHHWSAHYNEGIIVAPGGRGERYGRKVASKIQRMHDRSWVPAGRARLATDSFKESRLLLPVAEELVRVFTAPLATLGFIPSSSDRIQASLQTSDQTRDPGTES